MHMNHFKKLLLATVLSLPFVATAGDAHATGGTSMKVSVVKVGKDSITVRPAVTSEGHFGVWDLKLDAGKNTRINTLDGNNQIKSLKKGMVAEVVFEYAPSTSIVMVPIYTKIGNTTTVTMIPIVRTSIRGDILEIREIPGRCTSKTVRIGGKGEKVTVGICRVGGNFEIIANVSDASDDEAVLEALMAGSVKVTNLDTNTTVETKFSAAGDEYAHANVGGAPGHTIPIRIYIVADGPHDGKPEQAFAVTSRTRL